MARTITAVRNTCFAILSAIESDLRDIIGYFCLEVGRLDILPGDVRISASSRFQDDKRELGSASPETDLDLLPYTDFADLSKMLYSLRKEFADQAGVDVTPLAKKLEAMAAARNRVCHSRPLHEDDLANFLDLSKYALTEFAKLNWEQLADFKRKIDNDPTFVLRLEIPDFWRTGDETIHHNIPLPDYDDTSFLGRVDERKDVKKYLLGHHPVITIVGEGGVGKSALAMQCTYDLMDLGEECPFDAMVWVSLKTRVLTARGVESIRDSVVNVLGVMQDLAIHLGSPLDSQQDLEAVRLKS
jgi:LuxR family transcriptional regulator, glucitol operon activator